MQHALITIEQNAPSATAPKATPEILSGKPNYAAELVDMLANTEEGATTVERVVAMATTLTCEEFDESLKRARDVADTIDAAAESLANTLYELAVTLWNTTESEAWGRPPSDIYVSDER